MVSLITTSSREKKGACVGMATSYKERHVGGLVQTTVEDIMMHMKNASTLQFRYEY